MGKYSRSKGQRGERQWRDRWRDEGFEAERGKQRSGSPDSPDVKVPYWDDVFQQEVKWVEKLNLGKAMEKAIEDAGPKKAPLIAHKKSGEDFLVTMRAQDWFKMLHACDFDALKKLLTSNDDHPLPEISLAELAENLRKTYGSLSAFYEMHKKLRKEKEL